MTEPVGEETTTPKKLKYSYVTDEGDTPVLSSSSGETSPTEEIKMTTPESSGSGGSRLIDSSAESSPAEDRKITTPISSGTGGSGSSGSSMVIDNDNEPMPSISSTETSLPEEKKMILPVESSDDDSSEGYIEYVSSDSGVTEDEAEDDQTPLPKMLKFSDLTLEQRREMFPPKNPLFQLFSVRVEYDAPDKPGKLHGFILAADKSKSLEDGWVVQDPDGCNFVSLFYRKKDNAIPIVNNGFFPITDPTCKSSIPASETVELTAELYVTVDGHDVDLEVCNWLLTWDFSRYGCKVLFNSCNSYIASGLNGFVKLYYTAIQYAVDTRMELSFTSDSHTGKRVTGKIVAFYGAGGFQYDCSPEEEDYYKATLFEADDCFLEDGTIPLIRSMLIAPATCSLIVKTTLRDSSGDLIMDDSYEFPVKVNNQTTEGHIQGTGCSIDVKVDWKCDVKVDRICEPLS